MSWLRLQALAKTMRSGGTPRASTASTSASEAQSKPAPSAANRPRSPTSPAEQDSGCQTFVHEPHNCVWSK